MPVDPVTAIADRATPKIHRALVRAFKRVQDDADVAAFVSAVERRDIDAAVDAVTRTIADRLRNG